MSSVKFESKEISNIIRSLDVNNAHGHDIISIRMLRICVYCYCGTTCNHF